MSGTFTFKGSGNIALAAARFWTKVARGEIKLPEQPLPAKEEPNCMTMEQLSLF